MDPNNKDYSNNDSNIPNNSAMYPMPVEISIENNGSGMYGNYTPETYPPLPGQSITNPIRSNAEYEDGLSAGTKPAQIGPDNFADSVTKSSFADDPPKKGFIQVHTEVDDGVTYKRIRTRYLLFPPEHETLFNEIVKNHNDMGDSISRGYQYAMESYAGVDFADAIVKSIFGPPSYDFIIKYKAKREDENNKEERLRFEKLLVSSGLFIDRQNAPDEESIYLRIIMPFKLLCDEAERVKIKFTVSEEYAKISESAGAQDTNGIAENFMNMANKGLGMLGLGGDNVESLSSVFKRDKLEIFEGGNYETIGWNTVVEKFFSSSKRILLTYYYLTNLKLPKYKGKKTVGLRTLLRDGVFTEFFPLHDGPYKVPPNEPENLRAKLLIQWGNLNRFFRKQPLDDIADYYGEKVAYYFAFLGFYTFMLAFAAGLGIVVFIYGVSNYYAARKDASTDFLEAIAVMFDNEITIAYSILMSIWATVFLEYFKRYTMKLAFHWDVIGYEKEEIQRPEFHAKSVRKSPITGKWERFQPEFSYKSKKFVSACVVFVCIMITLAAVALLIVMSVFAPSSLGILPSLIYLVATIILTTIYYGIAAKLTNWENHRTETEYQNSFISKRFMFDFVNFYSSLLYIGVAKKLLIEQIDWKDRCYPCKDFKPQSPTDTCNDFCFIDLTQQLLIMFVGKQILMNFLEVGWPYLAAKYNVYKAKLIKGKKKMSESNSSLPKKDENGEEKHLEPHEKDDTLTKFDTLEAEYHEMCIQFGFVMLFVATFPFGALFAFLLNTFEIRLDAKKFLMDFQRPVPFPAASIGVWQKILNIVSFIAVLTNATLIAFSSSYFEQKFLKNVSSLSEKRVRQILFIVIYEHILFFVKLLAQKLIPDIPQRVADAIKREEYITRVAIHGEDPVKDDPEALEILAIKSRGTGSV